MDLNTLWFLLIGVLFTGFFVLEGFDYGVGILLPFLGKTDAERRRIINTIGPVWDGNEVWILTAGGAIFAAFPHWYATLFSGFYLALFLMLAALIVRGVAFEFRSKDENPTWRALWDWSIFFGSAIPALLWGVALANLLKGTPIDGTKTFTGGFFDLLSPYTLLAGLATLSLFITHGAIFLNLKSGDPIRSRALAATKRVGPVATVLLLLFAVGTYYWTDVYARLGVNPGLVPLLALGALLSAGALIHREKMGWAFTMTTPHHPLHGGDALRVAVPPGHGLEPRPGVEPHHLQRVLDSLHPEDHDHRGGDLRARRARLPGLDLLGLPSPHHRGVTPRVLIPSRVRALTRIIPPGARPRRGLAPSVSLASPSRRQPLEPSRARPRPTAGDRPSWPARASAGSPSAPPSARSGRSALGAGAGTPSRGG